MGSSISLCSRRWSHPPSKDKAFLYTGQGSATIPIDVMHVRVHPAVEVIGSKTFYNLHHLVHVELCESLIILGDRAFFGCKSLKRITIPSAVKKIDEWAFNSCHQLEEVRLLCGLTTIGDGAFKGCKSLRHIEIPSSVTFIESDAFSHCSQLGSVEIHEGLRKIGVDAFLGCISLKRIKIPSTVRVVDRHAFMGCDQLEELELCEGIELIQERAFKECKSLKYVRIPSTVKAIHRMSFGFCSSLEGVELNEGLLEHIDEWAFTHCISLKHICIPFPVTRIGREAFANCYGLVSVELCQGLQHIKEEAFAHCTSLKCIKIPSTVTRINAGTFSHCKQLSKLVLCDGLEQISEQAFMGCKSLKCAKIPSSVSTIFNRAFQSCTQLMSLELSEDMEYIIRHAFRFCTSLRNIAIPAAPQRSCSFDGCHDLLQLFGSQEKIRYALIRRFDGLPIHKICYYQSQFSTEVVIERLTEEFAPRASSNSNNAGQDTLGMTALHILASSTEQNLELYKCIIANQPNSLIMEDKWGWLPLMYALWVDAPKEIVEFLVDRQIHLFPEYVQDWDDMLESLFRAGASQDAILLLLEIHQSYFSGHFLEQSINSQKVARGFTICCLVRCSSIDDFFPNWRHLIEALGASQTLQDIYKSLLEVQQNFFPYNFLNEQNPDWKMLCEEIAHPDFKILCEETADPIKSWWNHDSYFQTFTFFARYKIPERLELIGVKMWRDQYQTEMKAITRAALNSYSSTRNYFDELHSKLVAYEHKYLELKEACLLLEMVLWKHKIIDSLPNSSPPTWSEEHYADMRRQCRISCGAETVITNVLPYLISSVSEGGDKITEAGFPTSRRWVRCGFYNR